MGHWMPPTQFADELDSRFPGCMAGRIMYVIPFSMGPLGSPLGKIGVQLTDANYVVLSMRIMTRVTPNVWDVLGENNFVRCIHSVSFRKSIECFNLLFRLDCLVRLSVSFKAGYL